MIKYKLKINYHNYYGDFEKGLILHFIDPYYKSKCEKLSLHEDYIRNNPDIFEEITPLSYTEDFADGSFFKKTCDNCARQGHKSICGKYCIEKDLHNWDPLDGEILGQAIYEGDEVWFASKALLRIETIQKGDTSADGKYFSNKQNAIEYHKSLQEKESCKTCEFEKKSTEMILCSRCKHRHHKLELLDNNWKGKDTEFQFEVDKWYYYDHVYFCFQEETPGGKILGYGFTINKRWCDNANFDNKSYGLFDWEPANVNEVKDLLILKAKKDYPKGTTFYDTNVLCTSTGLHEIYNHDKRIYNNGNIIYNEGDWAEIIKKPKKWDIGTYIVVVSPTAIYLDVGSISKITSHKDTNYSNYWVYSDTLIEFQTNSDIAKAVKWFATKKEAEEFAKTLKSKLMLGDIEVIFKKEYDTDLHKNIVWTKRGSVTFKEWLQFYNFYIINPSYNISGISEVTCKLNNYNCVIHPKSEDNSIGCIRNVSFAQMEEITKAINQL